MKRSTKAMDTPVHLWLGFGCCLLAFFDAALDDILNVPHARLRLACSCTVQSRERLHKLR